MLPDIQTSQVASPRWKIVLLALFRSKQFVSLEELTKLAEIEEPDVMNALTFLASQSWVECQEDGSQWGCTAQARAILEHQEASPAMRF